MPRLLPRFLSAPKSIRSPALPLRWVLVVPFVLQTVGAVALVGYLSYRSGQQAVFDLANQLTAESGRLVVQKLDQYLAVPKLAAQSSAYGLRVGHLDGFNLATVEPYLVHQLQTMPELSTVTIANENREFVAVERSLLQEIGKPLTVRRFNPADGNFYRYAADQNGKNLTLQDVRQNFDPHNDPPGDSWYAEARRSRQGGWRLGVNLSQGQDNPILQLMYSLAFTDQSGRFQGVVGADVALTQMGSFLASLHISKTGQVFLIDEDGLLVATSTKEVPFNRKFYADHAQNVAVKPRRLLAAQSQNPLTRAAVSALLPSEGTAGIADSFEDLLQVSSFRFEGQRYFVQAVPLEGDFNWFAVTVVPEADFMPAVWNNARRTLLLCLLTLLGSIGLGWLTARPITQPILKLNRASLSLAKGKWQSPLAVETPIAELKTLTRSFNQTAEQLQQSFDRIKNALEESEEKFTRVFWTSPDPVLIATLAEGRILEVNSSQTAVFGYSRAELIGRTTLELNVWVSLDNRQQFRELLQQQGSVQNIEAQLRTRSGAIKTVLLSAAVQMLDGQDCVIIVIRDISNRKADEAALQASEAKLRDLLNSANASIANFRLFADRRWQYEYWSEGCEMVFGYTAEEFMADPTLWYSHVLPEDIEQGRVANLDCFMQETIATIQGEYRFFHKDGSLRWSFYYATSRPDSDRSWVVTVIDTDITNRKRIEEERKQAELALKQTLQELSYHIENSPLATIRWNREARVEYWSRQAEQIFGWTAAEAIGKSLYEWRFVHEDDQEIVNQAAARLLAGTNGVCLNRNYCKDGSIVFCEWYNSVLLDEEGEIISLLSLVQDVTNRKRAEQELQQAKDAAEAANRAKSIFLANMSHELRTPLHSILGFTQLMQRDSALPATYQNFLSLIYSGGDHLLKLINEILDLSKIEAGRLSLQNQPFDLHALLYSLEEMFSPKDATAVAFHLHILPGVPRSIVADAQKLRQVLNNLVGNAIKFTSQGQVTLRVGAEGVGERESAEGAEGAEGAECLPKAACLTLSFEVEDTGVGIAPQDLNLIFDAFAQANAENQTQGTGLGLTISRSLVQLMGGDIMVSSSVGQGSCFRFTIPVQPIAGPTVPPLAAAPRVIGLAPGQPAYRILIVDDHAENRLLLVHLLQPLGLELREAATGEAAVSLWQEWQPHLIWMDIRMPNLSGYEATQIIRAKEQQSPAATVIIALTAHASEDDRLLALAAGCNDHVSKPFREGTLFGKMAQHLGVQYLYG